MNFNNSHEAWGKTTYLEWVKSCGEIFYTGVCDTNWNPRDFFEVTKHEHLSCVVHNLSNYSIQQNQKPLNLNNTDENSSTKS